MIKVTVLNKAGQVGWAATFSAQEEADAWVAQQILSNSWGRPERWVTDTTPNEDLSEATDTREVAVTGGDDITEYLMPVEYTFQQADISAEVAAQALVEDGRRRQTLGAEVIAKVYSINESKNISAETFTAMMADTNLERIERMLWTGSLLTAKLMIQGLDGTYFTSDEKQSILDMLADY